MYKVSYTIEYTTTADRGDGQIVDVSNWYGIFTREEAEDWLRRNPVRDGKVIKRITTLTPGRLPG